MSRAFTKEPDGDQVPDDQPELPISPHPNYVTPAGFDALKAALAERRAALEKLTADHTGVESKPEITRLEREIRYYETRVASANPVTRTGPAPDTIAFGARVTFEDADGNRFSYQIVGEDEAEPGAGKISWRSPLARAALGSSSGDTITWERPNGNQVLAVVAIAYP